MSISTVVFLKFAVLYGLIFWYTQRQSKRLAAEVAEAKRVAAEAETGKAEA